MSWVVATVISLVPVMIVCLIVKAFFSRRLNDIDGLNGVHIEDRTKRRENVIGYFGDDA